MIKPKSVTSLELTMSMATCIIGVGILAFPRLTVDLAGTGAPITTMIAVCIVIIGDLMLAYLGNQYPEQTLFEYADDVIGKWLGGIVLLVIGSYFMELGALAAREFGEVVVTSVLPRTPIPVTVWVMLILAAIASRNDIAKFVRILTFYMPLVYFPALVIVALSLKSARMVNIMPVFAAFTGVPFKHIILSVCVVTALFQTGWVLGLIVPFMYKPKRAWFNATLANVIAGALYVIIIYSTLAVFGTEEIKNLLWPTLELAKTAALPSFFIERLDPVFLAVWVTAVFCAIVSSYYLSIQAFSHLFRLRDHRVFTLTALPVMGLLSAQPANIEQLYTVVKYVGVSGLPLTFGYPLILIVVHLIRGRSNKPSRGKVGAS